MNPDSSSETENGKPPSQAATTQSVNVGDQAVAFTTFDDLRAHLIKSLEDIADEPGDSEDVANIESLLRDFQDDYEARWNKPQGSVTDVTGKDEQYWHRLTQASNLFVRLRNRQNLADLGLKQLEAAEQVVLQPLGDKLLTQSEYTYKPLAPDAFNGSPRIRVLHLLSAPEEPLRCRIEHTDIASTPYTALSYEWGRPAKLFWIDVLHEAESTSQVIPLTANLYCALCDLRDSADITSKTFWIDQICIDQRNDFEKGRQVQLMGKIYAAATQVISYLGPGECSDSEGYQLLDRITGHFGHLYKDPMLHSKLSETCELYTYLGAIPGDLTFRIEAPESAWSSLQRLVYGPWTRRLWMVPEICVNATEDGLHLLRGVKAISFTSLAAIQMLNFVKLLPDWDKWFESERFFVIMQCWLIRSIKLGYGVNFMATFDTLLLSLSTTTECSDPRDRIYAILGLATDGDALGIIVDYGQTYEQVLHDTTVRMMSRGQEHYVFEPLHSWDAENVQNGRNGLPSWVSRWNQFGSTSILLHAKSLASWRDPIRFSKDKMQMYVPGKQVAIVSRVLHDAVPNLQCICAKTDFQKLESIFIQAMDHIKGGPRETILVSSITALQDWPFPECDQERAIRALLTLSNTIGSSSQEEGKTLLELHEDLCEDVRNPVKFILAEDCLEGRSICLLDEGRICLGPSHTQAGDRIVLFCGGRTAFVLRPHGSEYLYVGDAYVHGLMDGEITEKDGWEDLVQEFVLV